MFYVTDEEGTELNFEIYGKVHFTTERRALARAKKLSSLFPGRRFGIGVACSSSQFYLGRELVQV